MVVFLLSKRKFKNNWEPKTRFPGTIKVPYIYMFKYQTEQHQLAFGMASLCMIDPREMS
jgi:hypothetical protein